MLRHPAIHGLSALLLTTALVAVTAAPADAQRDVSDTCTAVPDDTYTDVPAGTTHAAAVACLRERQITAGTSATTFGALDPLRRDQLVTFLARTLDAAGVPLPDPELTPFDDVGGSVHAPAINRFATAGIVGVGDGSFRGRTLVSRAEMAALTAAALEHAGVLGETDLDVFTDDDGRAAEPAINRLAAAGVVSGQAVGIYAPDATLRRDQMASFLARALDLIANDGAAPETPPTLPPPPPPAPVRSAEGWLVGGGTGELVGTGGPTTRYTVEVADGLEQRQDVAGFAAFVEATLGEPERGWTSRGGHRLQRVDRPSEARVRVVLAAPATVDRLCAQAGLRTAGIYSCWNGRVAAINATRWFSGVAHVGDLTLYRTYLVNHEVGHALGQQHRGCPAPGATAPVMMQLTKSTYGCRPNPHPYP